MKLQFSHFLRKPSIALAAVVGACGMFAMLLVANNGKLDSFIGDVVGWAGVGKAYDRLAVYDELLLRASPESFFRFSSGYGRKQLANVHVKFPDGTVYLLEDIPIEAAEMLTQEKLQIPGTQDGTKITRYKHGFSGLSFKGSQLWGITLQGASGIQIDFGDGEFVGLPVPRERVLEVLGPPESWERTARGMP